MRVTVLFEDQTVAEVIGRVTYVKPLKSVGGRDKYMGALQDLEAQLYQVA